MPCTFSLYSEPNFPHWVSFFIASGLKGAGILLGCVVAGLGAWVDWEFRLAPFGENVTLTFVSMMAGIGMSVLGICLGRIEELNHAYAKRWWKGRATYVGEFEIDERGFTIKDQRRPWVRVEFAQLQRLDVYHVRWVIRPSGEYGPDDYSHLRLRLTAHGTQHTLYVANPNGRLRQCLTDFRKLSLQHHRRVQFWEKF